MTPLQAGLKQRYGELPDGTPPLPETMDAFLAQLLAHRSVRAFEDKPLPPGTLALLVAAAQSAATSSNLQAWSVVAVEDEQRKARLSQAAGNQAHIRHAPLFLVWLADLSRLERTAERVGGRSDANRYLEMFLVAAIDAALAAQNATIAAEALGLGTVYIGAMRNQPEAVIAELKLPPRTFALFGLCVGHPDPQRPAAVKPRLSAPAVLHRETYDSSNVARIVQRYDELAQQFQRSQSLPPTPWSQQVAKRVDGADSLAGRDRLADAIRAQGFAMD